ncbi:cathepsin W-like [Hyperolius riggenbachi]|uniref:cathepsin W-like n=1 Tax=Hyperolius riggenbachi TaxID=752182 RepID=UPI0035A2F2F8
MLEEHPDGPEDTAGTTESKLLNRVDTLSAPGENRTESERITLNEEEHGNRKEPVHAILSCVPDAGIQHALQSLSDTNPELYLQIVRENADRAERQRQADREERQAEREASEHRWLAEKEAAERESARRHDLEMAKLRAQGQNPSPSAPESRPTLQWSRGLNKDSHQGLEDLIVQDQLLHCCPPEVREFVLEQKPGFTKAAADLADTFVATRLQEEKNEGIPATTSLVPGSKGQSLRVGTPYGLTSTSLRTSTSSAMVQFKDFMQQFNRSYGSKKEFLHRLSVFSENMEEAARLQRDETGTAEYGVTKFSDLTAEEFRNYHGLNSNIDLELPSLTQTTTLPRFPDSHDWRKLGVISEVKYQFPCVLQGQQCRSCWAFAAVGNIEAQWGIQGCPKNLSVQQVIDCGPCNAGCRGGYTWDAYVTALENGLVTEEEYQYCGVRTTCRKYLASTAWIDGFLMLPKNETDMASYVGNNGTLTVILNSVMLQHYKKGIIHNVHHNCDPVYVDHAVLIVGYAKGKYMPHWIVKNSYGTDWGEKGYFRIFRGGNVCGITLYPLAATVNIKKTSSKSCPP